MKHKPAPNPTPTGMRLAIVLAGAFCSFAPLGVLMQMVASPPGTWTAGVVGVIISGLIAVAWASIFIFRRFWWILAVIPAQAALPPMLFGWLGRAGLTTIGSAMPPQQRLVVHAVTVLFFIVAGYFLMIRYTELQERDATRHRTELELASQIHRALVPEINVTTPTVPTLRIVGRSIPSSQMGGDLIDLVCEQDRADVYLADVSGHGVKAGIVMAMVKAAIRMRLRSGSDLASLLCDLDAVIQQTVEPGMFATFACMRFEHQAPVGSQPTVRASFALAGHLPILHYSSATRTVRELPNQALPLGVGESEVYAQQGIACEPGDTFLFLTDGLTEVADPAGTQLTMAAVRALFERRGGEPVEALHAAILGLARAHGPQIDDQTLMIVRVVQPQA